MTPTERPRWVLMVVLVTAGLLAGFVVGVSIGRTQQQVLTRQEAVKAGVAEWRPGPNGEAEFHWRKP